MIPQYLVALIRQSLAEDPRTNILDVEVKILGQRVFLMGSVESEERRRAAEQVVSDLLPGDMVLINELCIASYDTTSHTEGHR